MQQRKIDREALWEILHLEHAQQCQRWHLTWGIYTKMVVSRVTTRKLMTPTTQLCTSSWQRKHSIISAVPTMKICLKGSRRMNSHSQISDTHEHRKITWISHSSFQDYTNNFANTIKLKSNKQKLIFIQFYFDLLSQCLLAILWSYTPRVIITFSLCL